MPNKWWHQLNGLDADLRLSSRIGMEEGIKQIIIRQCGFELYNTRPYHNYEDWSDGYIIMGRGDGKAMNLEEATELFLKPYVSIGDETYILVSREDLDEAISEFTKTLEPDIKNIRNRIVRNSEINKKRWRY